MKKKYIIEIEETNHIPSELFDRDNYPKPGYYFNTDENNNQCLLLVPELSDIEIIVMCDIMPNPQIKRALMEFTPLPEIPKIEIPEFKIPEPIEITTGISEDVLLKAIAIAGNPEVAIALLTAPAPIDPELLDEQK